MNSTIQTARKKIKEYSIIIQILLILCVVSLLTAQEVPRSLYVLNVLGQTVSKMNLNTFRIGNNLFTVGSVPNRIYAHNNRLYVVNSIPDGITVIDPATDTVVDQISITTGSNPWDMAFVGSQRAYVTNWLANSVSIIDLENGVETGTIEVGTGPQGIIVINNTAYVCNSGGYPGYTYSSVSVIDIQTDSVFKTLDVPTNPQDVALGPNGNIYVVCTGNYSDIHGKIVEINPYGDFDFSPLVTDTFSTGGSPTDIVVTNAGKMYAADFGDGNHGFVYSVDMYTREILHTASNPIPVGRGAMALLYDQFLDNVYVNNFSDDAVQVLNPADGSVLHTFSFGDGPQHFVIQEQISESDPWADRVVSFTPGSEAGFGQNYFPQNVLGPPDPDPLLNEYNPSLKPQELLSLGEGGEIILEFTDNYIVDGAGTDFTVFENVFRIMQTGEPFIEAAFVAASMDGESWYEFPWDTSTFAGFAGVTPMLDNQHPTDPELSGGDSFDLADIGLSYAKYIRITDLGILKKEGLFNADFDLDAVVAVHSQSGQPSGITRKNSTGPDQYKLEQNYPNPFNAVTTIGFYLPAPGEISLSVFNMLGEKIITLSSGKKAAGSYRVSWNAADLASGVYFYRLIVNCKTIVSRKLMLMK